MRSRLRLLTLPAWAAVLALASAQPLSARIALPGMVMLCSSQGVRWVPAPPGTPGQDKDDCGKPCHALCQRKRVAHGASDEDDCIEH